MKTSAWWRICPELYFYHFFIIIKVREAFKWWQRNWPMKLFQQSLRRNKLMKVDRTYCVEYVNSINRFPQAWIEYYIFSSSNHPCFIIHIHVNNHTCIRVFNEPKRGHGNHAILYIHIDAWFIGIQLSLIRIHWLCNFSKISPFPCIFCFLNEKKPVYFCPDGVYFLPI